MKKDSKLHKIQIRCTKEELKYVDKCAEKKNMNRSDYARGKLFRENTDPLKDVQFVVKAQQLLNYLEDNYAIIDSKLEKKVDELWKNLL